jgi:hypothetical protein
LLSLIYWQKLDQKAAPLKEYDIKVKVDTINRRIRRRRFVVSILFDFKQN